MFGCRIPFPLSTLGGNNFQTTKAITAFWPILANKLTLLFSKGKELEILNITVTTKYHLHYHHKIYIA